MTWTMVLLAILISTLGRVFSEDAKTLIPRFCRFLLRRAASRINRTHGARFCEEWLAHLDETPELTVKLWHAISIYAWGAGRVGREIGYSDDALGRNDVVKRAFDLFVALMTAPAALLFTLIAVFAARLSGCRPFVAREVVGPNGRRFRVWKTGTMRNPRNVAEASAISDLAPPLTHGDCSKVPRGLRLIRRWRLDEIPMLWSVLTGDLSLVGPRMQNKNLMTLTELAKNSIAKPGISGLAQMRTMSSLEPTELAKLDQEYCERRSLVFDLKIISMTLASVLVHR